MADTIESVIAEIEAKIGALSGQPPDLTEQYQKLLKLSKPAVAAAKTKGK